MKILTSIKFAQTAGIAQVVLSFMDFIEKSKGNDLSIVAVNIIDQKKTTFRKVNAKKTSTISFGIDVPNIAEVVNNAKNLAEVKEKYEKVISAYQMAIKEEKPDLPNPVSSHFFEEENKVEKKNIGIVSRWTGIKNVRFCEELAEYNSKNGNKFVVNVITDLDKNNKIYKKLSKLVKFHKPKSNKNLASFYKNMGIVISPSHFETYGNVAKESVASGTPAMVNSNMGVSETFNNLGLNDWIINFNSVKLVYEKIENTIGETVQEDIRDKMKKLYAPNKIFNEIISVLNNAS